MGNAIYHCIYGDISRLDKLENKILEYEGYLEHIITDTTCCFGNNIKDKK